MSDHLFSSQFYYNIISKIVNILTSKILYLVILYMMMLCWIAMMLMQLNRAMMAEEEETPAEIHILSLV